MYLSVYLFVCLYVCLRESICVPITLCDFVFYQLRLCVRVSVRLSACSSVSLSVSLHTIACCVHLQITAMSFKAPLDNDSFSKTITLETDFQPP